MVLLTVNVLLGLVLSTSYQPPRRWWPYSRRRIFDVHNWTAYIALALVFLHPLLLLLFSDAAKFRPIHPSSRSVLPASGFTIAWARRRALRTRPDYHPTLKKQPPDLLDGEKVFVEICLLLVLAGIAWRVRYGLKAERPRALEVEFDETS